MDVSAYKIYPKKGRIKWFCLYGL